MKRLIPASVIFIVIIVLCVTSNILVCKRIKKAKTDILRCEELYTDGNNDKAYTSALKFKKKWGKTSSVVSAYSSHCPIDDISKLTAILPEAIRYQKDFEVKSTLNQIIVALNTVLKEQSFTLESLY